MVGSYLFPKPNARSYSVHLATLKMERMSGGAPRKFWLTVHVAVSVGWLGAVVGFFVLAVIALRGGDDLTTRSIYVALLPLTRHVIVPLSLASLLSGIAQSLITPWGVFRHYWVIAKLSLNVGATLLLFVHTRPIRLVADAAATGTLADVAGVRRQLIFDAGAAILALATATALSLFKPLGQTSAAPPRWVYASSIVVLVCLSLVVAAHVSGQGFRHH